MSEQQSFLGMGLSTEVTGEAAVDAMLESLVELDDLPAAGHIAAYEHAHELLRAVLDGRSPEGRVLDAPASAEA